MGPGLIITVRMLRSSQIEMSSHMPFVWMVLHFYHSHMEPVWPKRSRTGCMLPVTSQPSSYLPQELWLHVSHMGHTTTRVLPHSTSSLQLTFCFLSAHLLFIRQLFALDFSQTFTVSGLHSKSANGLLLNRLSGENEIRMGVVIENVRFITSCWWGVTSKQEEILKWNSRNIVLQVGRMLDVCFLFAINTYTHSVHGLIVMHATIFLRWEKYDNLDLYWSPDLECGSNYSIHILYSILHSLVTLPIWFYDFVYKVKWLKLFSKNLFNCNKCFIDKCLIIT